MDYFIDTEFMDRGKESKIDLISIGIISEDGREYYAQSCEYDPRFADNWVKENVFLNLKRCPHTTYEIGTLTPESTDLYIHKPLGQCTDTKNYIPNLCCPWRTKAALAKEVEIFMNAAYYGTPRFMGWCCAYDYVALCQLFGGLMQLPTEWPHYMHDLQHQLDVRGLKDTMLPSPEKSSSGLFNAHNALEDAKYIAKLYQWVAEAYPCETVKMYSERI